MTAPALVLLARGSEDPTVLHGLRKRLQAMRPELEMHVAFASGNSPSAGQVLARVARSGLDEVALIPMDLCRAFGNDATDRLLVERLRADQPELRVAVARPIGPESGLLNLVDRRLRDALSRKHVSELDGLILSAGDCVDARSASLMQRRARQWSLHHKLPVVIASTAGGTTDIADGIRSMFAQGRRHVAVGSWFLSADADFHQQAEVARRLGVEAVAPPFGVEPEVLDLALARYVVAAMDLIAFDDLADDEDAPAERHLHMVGA